MFFGKLKVLKSRQEAMDEAGSRKFLEKLASQAMVEHNGPILLALVPVGDYKNFQTAEYSLASNVNGKHLDSIEFNFRLGSRKPCQLLLMSVCVGE